MFCQITVEGNISQVFCLWNISIDKYNSVTNYQLICVELQNLSLARSILSLA